MSTNQHQAHDLEAIPTDLPKVGSVTIAVIAVISVVVLAGLFLLGYIPHRHRVAEANEIAAEQNDRPVVDIIQPRRAATSGDLILPGDARALQETSVYPRATGYLKKLYVDIGDHVKAGQLLAEIDAPEVDAQLNEAKAAVGQAQANLHKEQTDVEFAKTTLERYQSLSKTGAVTAQDLDEKQSALNQAKSALDASRATVTAAEAAVQRLAELQSFEKITAPFSGVVTARVYDVGALLTANNATGQPLFRLAETDVLRVFVNVPQPYITSITTGQEAQLDVRNFPGKSFVGKVSRNSGALDPATRTLRMQVDFPNPDETLVAGMYGQVKFQLAKQQPPLLVPTSAMMFQSDGVKVATVQGDNSIKFQKITVGRDLGTELEVLDGLTGNERVVSNPGERLADGVQVQVVVPNPPGQQPQGEKTRTAMK